MVEQNSIPQLFMKMLLTLVAYGRDTGCGGAWLLFSLLVSSAQMHDDKSVETNALNAHDLLSYISIKSQATLLPRACLSI